MISCELKTKNYDNKKKSYLEAQKIIKDYESQQLNISGVIGSSIPKPPKPPLCRVLREGV